MNPMREPDIRPARDEDLAALVKELDQEEFFTDRLARQAAGRGLLLTAWQENRPIGDVYLWWEPAEEQVIQDLLPDVPLLNHLEVHPTFRKHGTGTRLTQAAERVLARKHKQVALAVEETNTDAMRLYKGLDYREWPYPTTVRCLTHPEIGRPRTVEICHVLVKDLSPREA